jgi:hypothetical protein
MHVSGAKPRLEMKDAKKRLKCVLIVFVISYLFSSKGSPASYCDLFLSVNQPVDQSNVTVKAKQPRAAQAVSPVPAPTRDFTLFLT